MRGIAFRMALVALTLTGFQPARAGEILPGGLPSAMDPPLSDCDRGIALSFDLVDLSSFSLPIPQTPAVQAWVRYYAGSGWRYFVRELIRLHRYRAWMTGELRAAKLPEDLIYLVMIESSFNPVAVSRSGARGLWQFLPATAQLYGLRVDERMDERLDPFASTRAALQLLGRLHDQFKDWPLAIAAYNRGPGTIQRALAASHQESLWGLLERGVLTAEGANYVPKILAAALVSRYAAEFVQQGKACNWVGAPLAKR